LRVILIGGPSNVGKSTLAESLASKIGWQVTSTDSLARHPGRPWGQVKPHVAEYYRLLSVDELVVDVARHQQRIWPRIKGLITSHATDSSTDRLILEGSALRPEYVARLGLDEIAAVWLTASDGLLRERIHRASDYFQAAAEQQLLVDKFLGRTHRDNQETMKVVRRLHLHWLSVEEASTTDDLTDALLERLSVQPRA
jgi:2-phosphoglycerate kinase